ncbi:PREDICTED: uncharacterized protein LOC109582206 [Amphimedon queenslandica]|uniref:BEN domain-containing protein n=2 Tax=Amphimedon queenslandica TaxID=400682 RepID=A0AAN0J6R3_AMPQE|nr:PREDICTED: uncharacterized protein LOC109582206 [Amphimedon queenslandica]|eukprot:XP_019852416.1 PREDICTED: uncharacterized protein LOC109582206 [Amphimedon queenslandica]
MCYYDSDETVGFSESFDLEHSPGILNPPCPQQQSKKRPTRNRRLPLHIIEESIVPPVKKAIKGKVKVKCCQSGKVFMASADKLTKEHGEDLSLSDIYDGNSVIYDAGGKSYDVVIIRNNKATAAETPTTSRHNNKKIVKKRVNTALMAAEKETECNEDTQSLLDEASQVIRSSSETPKVPKISRVETGLKGLLIQMDKKLDKIERMLMHSDKYQSDVDLETEDRYIVNGIDLRALPANDAYGYGRSLLDALFTKKEQKSGVLLPTSKSPKPALDNDRVQLLFGCLNKRYKDQYTLSKMKSTLNQKCRDAKEVILIKDD